jgi:GDP/UDP-N,N'-diacetylbacillosamine 2-epimerase (hydrolysing)
MEGIATSSALDLRVAVTGSHLSDEFGSTYEEIGADGFYIDEKVDLKLMSDTAEGVAASMGLALSGFGVAWARLKPDLIVVLGDRYEIFCAVAAALVANIPVAHLHGGERTEGAIDEAFRHSITKMSHLHFVATEEYRRRVIQLGEDPARVFLVGGLGVDSISRHQPVDAAELEKDLGISFGEKSLLITFHPATLERGSAQGQMSELLAALEGLPGTTLIFSLPNADPESRGLSEMVREFTTRRSNARAFTSLGQRRYLSCMQYVDGVVGNSSSGLLEAPSFRKGTVNIGERQTGRVKAASVIDCRPEREEIRRAIETLYSPEFNGKLQDVKNPYGDGGASVKIVEVIERYPLTGSVRKSFYDLPHATANG